MKLYFAGADTKAFIDTLEEAGAKRILTSYYYSVKEKGFFEELVKRGFKIFLDSGGFTARQYGKEIDIKKYRQFLIENKDHIELAANLDVGTLQEQQNNLDYLREEFPVLPVYHMQDYYSNQEDREWLLKWIEEYDYILLGGMVMKDVAPTKRTAFLKYCFRHGFHKHTKFHAFGINAYKQLSKFPFYSADATSWLNGGRFGYMFHWNPDKHEMINGVTYKDQERLMRFNINAKVLDDYKARNRHSIQQFMIMEDALTKIWKARGVKWNN